MAGFRRPGGEEEEAAKQDSLITDELLDSPELSPANNVLSPYKVGRLSSIPVSIHLKGPMGAAATLNPKPN